MKVAVTGGAGFIGSHVCDALLKRGESVVGIDNFNSVYDPKIKENNIKDAMLNKNFKLYRTDITHPRDMLKILQTEKPSAIIHLAARAGVRQSIYNPQIYEKTNIYGTLNILEAAKKLDIKKVIFASSSSVYGIKNIAPFSEEQNTNYPMSPYAFTKRAGEILCYNYHALYGMDIMCLRFFSVYGPRGRKDMAPYIFTRQIYENKPLTVFGDGNYSRDYTYIADIVSGIMSSLDVMQGYEVINLGNSKAVTLNNLLNIIETQIQKKAIILREKERKEEVITTCADIKKARKILSYEPQTDISKGISLFIDWYNQHITNINGATQK